ncbi:SDR family NAD(P)-dependent oxidoreductase [Myxococcus sp. AM010]|uniref:SDR family NAD(P)-dependent oxidoreductase n=1 Tax=Myxococcus sp. AM010 TaxID=2745138 RepID=UPI0034CF92FB
MHVLINNAGVRSRPDALSDLDGDDLTRTFQVNAVAALRVTVAPLPRLRAAGGAKVANLSSNLVSIADNSWGGAYDYRMSKAALKTPEASSTSRANASRGDSRCSRRRCPYVTRALVKIALPHATPCADEGQFLQRHAGTHLMLQTRGGLQHGYHHEGNDDGVEAGRARRVPHGWPRGTSPGAEAGRSSLHQGPEPVPDCQ